MDLSEWMRQQGRGGRGARGARAARAHRRNGVENLPVLRPQRDWGWHADMALDVLKERAARWLREHTKSDAVLCAGDPRATLLCVGEAPERLEVDTGIPFAGRSGAKLNEALAIHGLAARPGGAVLTTNASLWYCPSGVSPTHEEIDAAGPWLRACIASVKPRAILALGATATKALVSDQTSVTRARGRWHTLRAGLRVDFRPDDAPKVRATWHPAHVLRERTKDTAFSLDVEAVAQCLAAAG